MSVVSYQVKVSALGLSIVQRSNTDCGVTECDRETSIMRVPRLAVCTLHIKSNLFGTTFPPATSRETVHVPGLLSANHSSTGTKAVGGSGLYYPIQDL